uniref:Alpha/beta hydrolase n=1 Tax=Globodera pallida TaxID=36090 RepID=A0A183BV97_GLOPA
MPKRDVAAATDYDNPSLNSFPGSVGRSRRFDAALRYIGLGKRSGVIQRRMAPVLIANLLQNGRHLSVIGLGRK